jgi:ABC-type transport system substrate-binding protein
MRFHPLYFFFMLTALSLLSSCKRGGQAEEEMDVFLYNQPNSITSLDPAFARSQNNIWGVHHLYNGLVELDDSMKVRPSLAKSWEIVDSGLTYRFFLRDDVYFHDDPVFPNGKGRKMIASDIAYSLGRLLDEEVFSPGSWIFNGKVDEVRPFQAENDSVFVLRLKKPFPPMLSMLTMQYCSVVPREAVEKYGDQFRRHPVGTGPFRYKNWIENQALALLANENYFEGNIPRVDGLLARFIGDRKTAYLELLQGKLDYISGLESSYVNDLLTPEGELQQKYDGRLRFLKGPFLNMEYLGINLKYSVLEDNPLQNKKVRQALNFAIDRKKMLSVLRNGVGKAADAGFIPRGLPSYNPSLVPGYRFDSQKAVQLLREAGYGPDNPLSGILLHTNKDYLDLCTYITNQWEIIGVKAQIEVVESGTLRQMMSAGKLAMFRASWIADYPDGESFLTVFYGKNPSPPNYTRFRNDRFDALYEQALLETDPDKRVKIYQEMDRIIVEEAPVIFLFYDETAVFTTSRVKGLKPNAVNLLDLKRVSLR